MKMEPEAKAASDIVLRSLAGTRPDVGVIGCLDVSIRILILTGLPREKAIDALISTLEQFKKVEG